VSQDKTVEKVLAEETFDLFLGGVGLNGVLHEDPH